MINIKNKRVVGVSKGNTNFSKIYKGTDLVFQKPNDVLIKYKTSDNQPIELKDYTNQHTSIKWGDYGTDATIIENKYDSSLGCCVIRFSKSPTKIPDNFFREQPTLTEVIRIPSTIAHIGAYNFYIMENLKKVDLSNAVLTTGPSNHCFWVCPNIEELKLPYGGKISHNSFVLTPSVVKLGQPVYQTTTDNPLRTIDMTPYGKTDTIPEYFLVESKYFTSFDFSKLPNIENIDMHAFFLSGINTVDLRSMTKLLNIRYGAFASSSIKRIIIPDPVDSNYNGYHIDHVNIDRMLDGLYHYAFEYMNTTPNDPQIDITGLKIYVPDHLYYDYYWHGPNSVWNDYIFKYSDGGIK